MLLPHTEESEAALLDIFNKLKPRYKKNNVHFIPPSPPPPTTLSINCDKRCLSFPPQNETTRQTEDQRRTPNHSLFRSDLETGTIPASGLSLNLSAASHTLNMFIPLWTSSTLPNLPPHKTHTCYMSAGTSDKTEGLDWDKVYQRPQSTFRCWASLWCVDWFVLIHETSVCVLQPSHHFTNNVCGVNGWAQKVAVNS